MHLDEVEEIIYRDENEPYMILLNHSINNPAMQNISQQEKLDRILKEDLRKLRLHHAQPMISSNHNLLRFLDQTLEQEAMIPSASGQSSSSDLDLSRISKRKSRQERIASKA